MLMAIITDIVDVVNLGVEIALVIGGGNIIRGGRNNHGVDRMTGDYMGMLATMINALALCNAFNMQNQPAHIMSALPIDGIMPAFNKQLALNYLKQKEIVIFAGGTGNPFFTTDTTASLRSIQIEANILLKATNVDGVYSADPATDKNAKRFERLTFQEALDQQLAVMDLAAFSQCRDHNMPIRVFNFSKQGALKRIISGESEGTLVDQGA